MVIRIGVIFSAVRRFIHKNRFRTAFSLFLLSLISQTTFATTVGATGTIGMYRIYTVSYSTSLTHDVSAFQLVPAMANGCTWVWLDASDKNALAVVLAAKTTGATVDINFDNAIPSPWGDASMCVLQLIALH